MKGFQLMEKRRSVTTARLALAAFVFLFSLLAVGAVVRAEASQQGDPPQGLLDRYRISREDFEIGRKVQIRAYNNSELAQIKRVQFEFWKKYHDHNKANSLRWRYFEVVNTPYDTWNNPAAQAAAESEAYRKKQEQEKKTEKVNFLDGKRIKVTAKAGPNGKLFGLVTPRELSQAIEDTYGRKIDKKTIEVPEIKEFGTYGFKVNLGDNITANMTVEVVPEN